MFHNLDFTNDSWPESQNPELRDLKLFYNFSTMDRFLIVSIIFLVDSGIVERRKDKVAK